MYISFSEKISNREETPLAKKKPGAELTTRRASAVTL